MAIKQSELAALAGFVEADAHRAGWGRPWSVLTVTPSRGALIVGSVGPPPASLVEVLLRSPPPEANEALVVRFEGWAFPDDVAADAQANPELYGPADAHPRRRAYRAALALTRDGFETAVLRRPPQDPRVLDDPLGREGDEVLPTAVVMAARRALGRPSSDHTPPIEELVVRTWLAAAAQRAADATATECADAVDYGAVLAFMDVPSDWRAVRGELTDDGLYGPLDEDLLAAMDDPMVAAEVLSRVPRSSESLSTFTALAGRRAAERLVAAVERETGVRVER